MVERARERTLARLDKEIATAEEVGDALARLKRIARWFHTANLDPQLVAFKRIFLSEAVVPGHGGQDASEDDPIMNRLISVVAAAQKAGAFRGGDPAFMAAHLLHCIALGPTVHAMLGRMTYSSEKAQDKYFDQAWELFLHGATDQ